MNNVKFLQAVNGKYRDDTFESLLVLQTFARKSKPVITTVLHRSLIFMFKTVKNNKKYVVK